MRDIVDAAVQGAARAGMRATVIVLEGGNGGGDDQYAHVEHDHYHYQQPQGTPIPPPPGQTPDEKDQEIATLRDMLRQAQEQRESALRQNDQVCQQLREAQASLAGTRAAPTQAPVQDTDQTGDIVDYDSMGIDVLNLPEPVVKVCEKKGIETIGQLRAQYKHLGKWRVNRKDAIAAAEALMDKIPSQHRPEGASTSGATGATTVEAADAPTGHQDRPWPDRLKVTRMKEDKCARIGGKVDGLYAAARSAIPALPEDQQDVKFWMKLCLALIPDDAESAKALAAYLNERSVYDISNAQALALLYALGFDPKQHSTVDAALEAAGLVHLVESIPPTPPAEPVPPPPPAGVA